MAFDPSAEGMLEGERQEGEKNNDSGHFSIHRGREEGTRVALLARKLHFRWSISFFVASRTLAPARWIERFRKRGAIWMTRMQSFYWFLFLLIMEFVSWVYV